MVTESYSGGLERRRWPASTTTTTIPRDDDGVAAVGLRMRISSEITTIDDEKRDVDESGKKSTTIAEKVGMSVFSEKKLDSDKAVRDADARRNEVGIEPQIDSSTQNETKGGSNSNRNIIRSNRSSSSSSDDDDDDDDYDDLDSSFEPPDGGLRAWSQVVAAHLINAMTWGYASSFGVYQLHYAEALRLPAAQISWIGSVQVFLSLAVCTVSGRLSDAGHARATVAAGSALAVLGTLATSFARAYWQILLAQGVCTGLGLGLAFMPAVSVTSSYFRRNRPLALSVAAVGTSMGSIVFPATVHYLTPCVGFPWAVRCAALIALVFCVVACLLLKPYLPPRKTGPWVEWTAFRELPYLLFALGVFLNFYILFFGFFYINSYARNIIGFSSLDSITILLITNALGVPTRPIAGYLANAWLGPINVFTLSTVALCVVVFAWAAVASRPAMYAYSVVFGVFVSANQGTFIAALASLTTDPRRMGVRFGMVETLCSFASLAGPPTAGAIIDRSGGDYLGAQIWGGCVLAVAALLFVAARVAVTGWRWKVKI